MSDGPGAGGEGRARLFVALELPGVVRSALVNWAGETVGGEPGVRLLDVDALHLTLCFLGEVELSAVEAISAAVASEVARGGDEPPPFVFEPDQVRWLPPRRPRVCAVSLRDRDGRAGALQAALSTRLSEGGWYSPERRAWLAHVTVARMSSRDPRGRREVDPAPPVLEPFGATAVVVMRSWPGSRYEALARIVL
ncbi:MAG TPA: RNA 2',3'-cyclic phosphodiesterase [Solirubrobacteraceae bacterium]